MSRLGLALDSERVVDLRHACLVDRAVETNLKKLVFFKLA